MASGFLDELLSGIFGDSKRPDTQRPDLVVPMLAHWLPYRSFDPKTGIFYNSASRGFVIEAAPEDEAFPRPAAFRFTNGCRRASASSSRNGICPATRRAAFTNGWPSTGSTS